MSIDQFLFRRVMSRFASGVTVVTTAVGTELFGITVSSFASLSLEPALVLICIDQRAPSHAAIATSGFFAVHILKENQEELSQRFASQFDDKFVPDSYTLSERGMPILHGVLATLECRVFNALPGGDHTIYVGDVIDASAGEGWPLIYYQAAYRRLADPL